ncbi:hypothetical protein ES702_02436 [subsurface metagenome]
MWLKTFFNWFTGKKNKEQLEELKEILPEEPILKAPPPPPIKKGSLEDIRDFCDEMRKDLRIRKRLDELHKKTDDRLYVEFGNLKNKIERFLKGHK